MVMRRKRSEKMGVLLSAAEARHLLETASAEELVVKKIKEYNSVITDVAKRGYHRIHVFLRPFALAADLMVKKLKEAGYKVEARGVGIGREAFIEW